jgi:carbonic anhydrase/acetyltransferase-like protein (isoleucine patch superfamily)
MATILPVEGKSPASVKNCFVAPNATVVGDVKMGNDCSIWFNAVVRGDVNSIHIGNKVNIQDGVIIHGTYKKSSVHIGNDVSIGHNAIVHGCTIQDRVLIGMGAIMSWTMRRSARIRSLLRGGCAGRHPDRIGTIYGGIPAKKIKEYPPDLITGQIERIAKHYCHYADWFKE